VKVGDFVRFATGRGRETDVGLLISIEDNPGELATYPIVPVRKIGHVLSNGEVKVAWLDHIHPESVPEGGNNESR
jgi:hypothetical protein